MTVDVQEVKGYAANTKEVAVLVQNNCVAESIAQLNFHEQELVCWMGSMDANPDMPQHAMR